MSCDQVQALLEGGLAPGSAQHAAVEGHLSGCPACREVARQEAVVRAYLRALPEVRAPHGLERRLMAIPRQAAEPAWPPVARWVAVAVVGAGLFAAGWRALSPLPGRLGQPPLVPLMAVTGLPPATGESPGGDGGGDVGRGPSSAAAASAATVGHPEPAPALADSRAPAPAAGLPVAAPALATDAAPPSTAAAQPPQAEAPPDHQDEPDEDEPATAVSPPPSILPTGALTACVVVDLTVFLDLAGDGDRAGCEGCDGRFDEQDRILAERMGLRVPDAKAFALFGVAGGDTLEGAEELPDFHREGAVARLSGVKVCGRLPIRLGVTPSGGGTLDLCSRTPRLQELDPAASSAQVSWSISPRECATLPPPEVSPTMGPARTTETPEAPVGEEPGTDPQPTPPEPSPTPEPSPEPPHPYPTIVTDHG